MNRYPEEALDSDYDNGTMPNNVNELTAAVIGHRIVKVETSKSSGTIITLDNGKQVVLTDTSDCCAYTQVQNFLLHPDRVDHIITGVGTTDRYTTWHIYADLGDVLELEVGWSAGNPFYYGYGFDLTIEDSIEVTPPEMDYVRKSLGVE